MADSCVLTPSVRTPEGTLKESKLFGDILSVVGNRTRAVDIYFKVKNPEFQIDFGASPRDENGELKLSSVVNSGIFPDLTSDKVSKRKMIEAGFADKDGNILEREATIDNVRSSYEKADRFNKNNDDYIAIPEDKITSEGNHVVTVKIEKATEQNISLKEQISNEIGLHNTLVGNLREERISVGALDSLEEHLLDHGVTDFTNLTRTTSEGLLEIIRLGKGRRGMAALPEEFSHFVIEACTDTDLINRLINFISDDEIVSSILGDEYEIYNRKYNGDKEKLAREAAAKLLALHLKNVFNVRSKTADQQQVADNISSLLDRVWGTIRNRFSKLDESKFSALVDEAKRLFDETASKALDRQLLYDLDKASKVKWFDTSTADSNRMERKRNLLLKIIENQTKRYNIAEKRAPESAETAAGSINISGQQTGQTPSYTRTQRELKIRLEEALAAETYQAGIYDFLNETFKGIKSALAALSDIDELEDGEEKALRLNRARDFIHSYTKILEEIKVELEEDPELDSDEYKKALEDVNGALLHMTSLKAQYRRVSKSTLEQFIAPYFRDRGDNPFSDEEMNALGQILESSPKDISLYDLWLRSASNSSNEVIRLLDHIIKRARERGRQKTIEHRKRLEALGMKAKNAGITDFNWMFEQDFDGHKSGSYIQSINYAEYNRRRNEKIKELHEKYPNMSSDRAQKVKYWNEFNLWINDNTEEDVFGDRVPKYSIYKNTVYDDIMTNPAKSAYKDFYTEFLDVKQELDALLPLGKTDTFGAIKIRKDLLERVLAGGKMTHEIAEAIKDGFIKRGDDVDADYEEVVEDFEGRKVNSLPIYYTQLRPGESPDDLSTDVISTMIAYAAMANDYYEMNSILQRMELGRNVLLDKEDGYKVGQTKGQKKVEEVLDVLGQKIHKQLTKENTNFEDRLNALYEMSLYSQRRKDEGTFGNTNIDKGKTADKLNAVTALNTLALNLTAGITNVVTGTAMLRIEAAAKEFMAYKNILQGDRAYGLAMPAFLAEFGSPVKTNKLSLFDEKFNVMQEYEGQIRNTNFDRKTWFKRLFEGDTLFFLNNCGEHWLQNRTALGLAYAYKMKGPNGEESNLWDALEVIPIDKEHPEYGARLEVKEGYTKPDGSQFTDDDVFEFTRKAAAINQRMHGIYNKEDMNVAQRIGLGRMALLFRKYLVPSIDRRFRKEAIYNYDLGTWEQGYYITAYNFLGKLCSDLKEHRLNISLAWNNLSEPQKMNIRRALTEVGYFLAIVGALALLKSTDKDRKSRSFFLNEFELQLKRQRAEVGTLTPTPLLLNEALKTLKSPAAGIDTLEDMLGTLGVLYPWNWTKEMQSGRYKGHSRAYKLFMTSPFVPMNSTIYKSLHPEELIPFYNQ